MNASGMRPSSPVSTALLSALCPSCVKISQSEILNGVVFTHHGKTVCALQSAPSANVRLRRRRPTLFK